MSGTTQVMERAVETRTRLDSRGKRYEVASLPCDGCGCPWDYSIDEMGVSWDAGPEISDECSDPECTCHVDPVIGIPLLVHVRG